MKLKNQDQASEAIQNREAFLASALWAIDGRSNTYGMLNPEEIEQYEAVRDSIDFVVMSYKTPIAWHSSAGWYMVKQKFSVTTSRHQGIVRRALNSKGLVEVSR
jgi:hypothetical protein